MRLITIVRELTPAQWRVLRYLGTHGAISQLRGVSERTLRLETESNFEDLCGLSDVDFVLGRQFGREFPDRLMARDAQPGRQMWIVLTPAGYTAAVRLSIVWAALVYLASNGPASAGDASDEVGIDPDDVEALLAAGLLAPADPVTGAPLPPGARPAGVLLTPTRAGRRYL